MEILLIIFNKSPKNDQIRLRDIRNQPDIRNNMYTNHIISKSEHLKWISSNKNNPFFLIYHKNNSKKKLIGLIGLKELIDNKKTSHWFFYLEKESRGATGVLLEFSFIDYAFSFFGLKVLYCEVFDSNTSTIHFHKKFGFIECDFIQKIYRDKKVITLSLNKEAWIEIREFLFKKYKKIFDKASIEIINS